MIHGFNSSRIREEFASIQGICTERKRALSQFSSFRRFRLLRPAGPGLDVSVTKLVLSQTRDRALPLRCHCKILQTRTGISLASD